MKAVAYALRLIFMLTLLLISLELTWRLMTPGQRNYLIHQIPAPILQQFPLNPAQPSLIQRFGPRVLIPERPLSGDDQPSSVAPSGGESRGISISWPGQDGPVMHANGTLCLKPDFIKPPEPKAQVSGVYKWVDENGKVHFGDKPTETSEDLSKRYQTRNSGMELVMEYRDWSGNKSIEADLQKEAELMYRIFSQFVPKAHRRPVVLNITLFENRQRFDAYRVQQGIGANTGAFYRGEEHRIYMPMLRSEKATRAVARHEMTHAMTVAMLGTLPIWLMEGIAEYMQRLKWQMSAASVPVDVWALRHVNPKAPATIKQLTGMSHQDFYARGKNNNYARASLLVHFLIGHADGKAWLKQSLARFAEQPCRPFDPEQEFNSFYPGGLASVSERFEQWLDAREHLPHRY
ncbi:MAG: hypothetical protein CMI09_06710 [Oceanospirillaceae bacterium]|nr:hypothetical protein [Oceanospirillaceae bacterium]